MFQSAFAIYEPGWERPVKSAQMKITQATFSFQTVNYATITMTRKDGHTSDDATGITLEYGTTQPVPGASQDQGDTIQRFVEDNQRVPVQEASFTQSLTITHQSMDRCGTVRYVASRLNENNQPDFTVYLADHSGSICLSNEIQGWTATVRHGSGALTATMELVGKPEAVATIQ
jgi:hypothetical protein